MFKRWERNLVMLLALGMTVWLTSEGRSASRQTQAVAAYGLEPMSETGIDGAYITRLGRVFADGAGPMVNAHSGDWVLSNDLVSFTFADVATDPDVLSLPLSGRQPTLNTEYHKPGALIDVEVEGNILDMLGYFTQGLGLKDFGPEILYDSVEPLVGDGEVGLRFEGAPEEQPVYRLQTTYWLRPGERSLRIVTRWSDELNTGVRLPDIVDVGEWGKFSRLFLPGLGFGPDGRMDEIAAQYTLVHADEMSLGLFVPEGMIRGRYGNGPARSRTYVDVNRVSENEGSKSGVDYVRYLYAGNGEFSTVTDAYHKDFSPEGYGTVGGKVLDYNTEEPIPHSRFVINDIIKNKFVPISIGQTDAEGKYKITMPVGSYMLTPLTWGKREKKVAWLGSDIEKQGDHVERTVYNVPQPTVKVKVVDKNDGTPRAARVRLEPLPGTEGVNYGSTASAAGFLDYTYIPPQGREIELPLGHWVMHACHGIRFGKRDMDVVCEQGTQNECVIEIEKEVAMDGWLGLEIGMRTTASPGCLIEPRDAVLMAAAEDLHWLISGDLDVITDFEPYVKELGLEGVLKTSRGFRTFLPKNPGLGHFLIYPVAKDAPDPQVVREQWQSLSDSTAFIDKMHELYPGALIHVDMPLINENRYDGYFAYDNMSPYRIGFEPNPEIDLRIDNLTFMAPRRGMRLGALQGFLQGGHQAKGRHYLAATASEGRSIIGAEPGYPRLMLDVGQSKVSLVNESQVVDAMRQKRAQLTTGPFVDFTIDHQGPGSVAPLKGHALVNISIEALPGIGVATFKINKEGREQNIFQLNAGPMEVLRHPVGELGEQWGYFNLRKLKLRDWKDSLLTIIAGAEQQLDKDLPLHNALGNNAAYSITQGIIVDHNNNGVFDPIEKPGDIAR